MVRLSKDLIDGMVDAVVREVDPQRIYLFGSCAKGITTADSDVDLLVIEDRAFDPSRKRWCELKRIRRVLKPFRVPKDILVYSRDEFDYWRDSVNHIIAHATRHGKLVYERS